MPVLTGRVSALHCQYCGREFYAGRSDTRYCSDSHRQAEYRERKAAQQETRATKTT